MSRAWRNRSALPDIIFAFPHDVLTAMDYDQEMIRYRREFRRTKMSAVAQAWPPDSALTELSALAAEITRMAFLVWERL